MRVEKLIKRLEETLRQNNASVKKRIPKYQLERVCYMGICDREILDYIVPQLVYWEINGGFSKEHLAKFIADCPDIHILPEPIRHETDSSETQRRADSLARLISIDVQYTACVAVACCEGRLIVSANDSKTEEKFIEDCFKQKIGIIRDFLANLARDVPAEACRDDIIKIEFSSLTNMYAYRAVRALVKTENGGVGEILPAKTHRKHSNTEKHLVSALLKLGQSYLLSLYTNGKQGLSINEARALSSGPITMVSAKRCGLELGTQMLHAEQAITYYLRYNTDCETEESSPKVNIGVSKLCCNTCFEVLSKPSHNVAVRGTHGMTYPNVHDIDTGTLSTCHATKIGKEACPSDSESDCEFYDEGEPADVASKSTMHVPSLQKLLSGTPTKERSPTSLKKLSLFGPCRDAAHASIAPQSSLHRVIIA